MAAGKTLPGRKAASPRAEGGKLIQKAREQDRRAIEKAIEIAVKVYGPAFKELENY